MSVLVLPCDSAPRQAELAQLADDLLIKALVEQHRFRVIEREKLQQVLREQKLVREKLVDPANPLRLGRLASADSILATSIREEGASLVVVCRLFTTETTAELEFSARTTNGSLPGLRALMRDVAARLALSLPLAEGVVLRSQQGTVVASIGSAALVRRGMGAIVYRRGKELT
ncbi:MAG TPA: CsgG/HfaB family protein, partial [Geobacteraceae bacterium]